MCHALLVSVDSALRLSLKLLQEFTHRRQQFASLFTLSSAVSAATTLRP